MITHEELTKTEYLDLVNTKCFTKTKIIDDLFSMRYRVQDKLQQHIKSLEAQLSNTEQLTCEWKLENDEMNSFSSSCSYVFYLEEGTPKMNDMNFCPKCGGKITQKDTK